MDKGLSKFMKELGLESIKKTPANWSSISEAVRVLWSEAADAANRIHSNSCYSSYNISDEDIFRQYEALVKKHMIDTQRPSDSDDKGSYTLLNDMLKREIASNGEKF